MYCEEAQLKRLVLKLRDRFPGSELVFDAFSPLHILVGNLQVPASTLDVRFRRSPGLSFLSVRKRNLHACAIIFQPAEYGWLVTADGLSLVAFVGDRMGTRKRVCGP